MGVRTLLKRLRASDDTKTSATATATADTHKEGAISTRASASTLHPEVSAPISAISENSRNDNTPRDLWDEAYATLSREDPKLKQMYENVILTEGDLKGNGTLCQNNLAITGSYQREEQLRQIVKKKVEEIDLAQWRVQVGGHTVDVSGQFDKAVKIVLAVKDYVSSAVNSEPHAALAWAGVCIFLPLLLNPSEQKIAARDGLEALPFAVRRLRVMERLIRPGNSGLTEDSYQPDSLKLVEDFENTAVELYKTILEFQLRLVRQHSDNWAKRYGRKVFKADDWTSLTSHIKTLETKCTEIAQDLSRERIERALQDSDNSMQQGLQRIQEELEKTTRGIEKQIVMQSAWRQSDEERKCLQLFRESNPYEDQKNRTPKRVLGTGNWFFENRKFLDWRENEGPDLLWLSAKPGSGKSVLARTLIDEGLVKLSHQKQSAVSYFFFKDISPYQRSALSAISAILHQLFSAIPSLVRHALIPYGLNGKELLQLFDEMFGILCRAAADPAVGQVVCVLDALDECNDSDRSILVEAITNFYRGAKNASNTENQPKLKLLLTSRPYSDIHSQFHDLMKETPTIHLSGDHESEKIKEEIDHVVDVDIPKLAAERGYDEEATNWLVEKLHSVENRTYLWLSLIREEIRLSERPSNRRELHKIISNLPPSVMDAFDSILKRCRHPELARQLLHIILAAHEPLSVDDMKIATVLASDLEYRSYKEVGVERSDAFEMRIKNVCGLMVTIEDDLVFLIHQTAKEFLVKDKNQNESCGIWRFSFSPLDSEILMAKICVSLLSFTCFSECSLTIDAENAADADEGDDKISQYSQDHAFLKYAAMNWVQHAQDAILDENSEWMPSILSLCTVDSWMFRTWYTFYQRSQLSNFPWKTTSLNLAAEFGFENVIDSLLKSGEDPNEIDGHGATPLARSVRRSKRAVELLLDAKADINSHTWEEPWHYELEDTGTEISVKPFTGTPLTMAALEGNTEMIEYLINRGARIDFPPSSPLTPLSAAFIRCLNDEDSNRTEILRLLVRLGANVCFENTGEDLLADTTVLHSAAMMEDSSILKILLDSETADLNFQLREASGNTGAGPIDEYTDEKRLRINEPEILINTTRNCSPDVSCTDSAIRVSGCEDENSDGGGKEDDIASISQNSEKSFNSSPDHDDYQSDLFSSIENTRYMIGATPLQLAAAHGLVENVKLLLQNGANPHLKNANGYTAMDFALELSLHSIENCDDPETLASIKREMISLLEQYWHRSTDGKKSSFPVLIVKD
ncbi:uncharacterized protein N7483_006446 [Penicillium malachiteum]|uniref:uncharacterized protein n=1 Tax=Penicillium malachiteum TaxID=1324776 RepID=UPI00254941A4|nr:uncharacterized protein N7483_006446 [Penicillium malachiteum]KAJ5725089.1 hypothetical protein N7483_006446 [Penicillium malachiteum]